MKLPILALNRPGWLGLIILGFMIPACRKPVLWRVPGHPVLKRSGEACIAQPESLSLPLHVKWKIKLASAPASMISAVDSVLFIAAKNGQLTVIDMNTGKKIWQKQFKRKPGLMCFPDDSLLFLTWPAGRPSLTAMTVRGDVKWSKDVGPVSMGLALPAGRLLFAGTESGMALAAEKRSGEIIWEKRLGHRLTGHPVLADTAVICVSDAGMIWSLASGNGSVLWQRTLTPEIVAAPVIHGRTIVVMNSAGNVWALDSADGALLWQRHLAGGVFNPACADSGKIFIGTTQGLYCLDSATGEPAWQVSPGTAAGTAPVIAGDQLCIGMLDRHLLILNKTNGEPLWRFEMPGRVRTHPLVLRGMLIAGSEDNHVYGFEKAP
ncbi:PQQ-binding-like beta-propeller repeat protein [bacterium]|nr:PQQ-binding-like beta-propeller repeat protein [bacterium]